MELELSRGGPRKRQRERDGGERRGESEEEEEEKSSLSHFLFFFLLLFLTLLLALAPIKSTSRSRRHHVDAQGPSSRAERALRPARSERARERAWKKAKKNEMNIDRSSVRDGALSLCSFSPLLSSPSLHTLTPLVSPFSAPSSRRSCKTKEE